MKSLNVFDRDLAILLTDDAGIQVVNRQYLGKDKPTNVISFAMSEGEPCGTEEENILGDVVISVETALRDSEQGGLALEHEIDFLIIHGVLHLVGFDHVHSKTRAKEMAQKERELFYLLNGFELE